MKKTSIVLKTAAFAALFFAYNTNAFADTATFDDYDLEGAAAQTTPADGVVLAWGNGGASFKLTGGQYGMWSGFKVSAGNDTSTTGYANQYSAKPGIGYTGNQYAVMYGDFYKPDYSGLNLNPDGTAYTQKQIIEFGYSVEIQSIDFANTTYAYFSMKDGDAFAKPLSTQDGAYLKVMVAANTIGGYVDPIEFVLAENNGGSVFILADWYTLDLSGLNNGTGVLSLEIWLETNFIQTSSGGRQDVSIPSYVALDNIAYLVAIPESSTYAVVFAFMSFTLALIGRRRD